MSKMKRVLAVFLALLMVVTCFPVDALADRTENSTQVQTGESEVNVEGTNSFGNLLSEDISESQEEAAEASSEYPTGYAVVDLRMDGSTATVTYDSMEEAMLVVALYTEDGMQMLNSASVQITPDAKTADVTLEGEIPEYFMASAYLVDVYDYSPLCAAYDTPLYTKEMQELLASSVEDYGEENVLKLDESNDNNFAVYAEDTIVIEYVDGYNIVTSIDEEASKYVIENCDSQIQTLSPGDIFVYGYEEGNVLIVKIDGISTFGTTTTIFGTDVAMEEVFSHVKISGDGTTSDMEVDEATGDEGITYEGMVSEDGTETISTYAWEDSGSSSKSMKFGLYRDFKVSENAAGNVTGTVRVKGTMNIKVDTEFEYYIAWTRQYVKLLADTQIDTTVTIAGRFSYDGWKMKSFGFSPVTGVYIDFTPTLIFRAEAALNISFVTTFMLGASFESGKGLKNLGTQPKTVFNDLYIEGTFFFGVDMKPRVGSVGIDLVDLTFYMPIGLEIKVKMTGTNHDEVDLSENPAEIHTCADCLKISPSFKFELRVRLKLLNSKKLTFELYVGNITIPLKKMYYSVDHSELGLGNCPYKDYRLTVSVSDEEGKPVSGASISAGEESAGSNANGVGILYLPEGKYTVTASADDSSASKSIELEEAMKVHLSFRPEEDDPTPGGILGEIDSETVTDDSMTGEADYNNNRYELYDVSMTWTEANAYCENLGGHLATITSAEEQAFVVSLMTNGNKNQYWIGAHRTGGSIVWVTGEEFTYSNWDRGEPNRHSHNGQYEDYIQIYNKPNPAVSGSAAGKWNDIYNNNVYPGEEEYFSTGYVGFICEFESEEPTEPATDMEVESEEIAPTVDAVFGGEYGTEFTDTYTLKTASFKNLVPNEQYVLYALKDLNVDTPLTSENLLYVDQGSALEDGTLSFKYVQRTPSDISYVIACGASNKNLSDAQITFPEMTVGEELQTVNPTVVYDGETLLEGKDYVIVGTTDYTKAGTYTCYIRGIRKYTGLVECSYTVASDVVEVANGWSGDTTWTLTDDGALTFTGEGAMKNYTYKSEMPWYEYLDQITSVVIESGVTRIGDYAFYGAPNLETITIPESVTTIGSYAFKNAVKLNNVDLPSGVTRLGESAFYACTALTSIEIPASLWTIQPYTFKNCTALTEVTFNEGNLQKISDGAFYGTGLTEIVLPDCLDILDAYTFKNCADLTSITIGTGLTELREAVFYGTAIDAITIPEGITKVGPYAFKNCVKLETIDLPSTLASVEEASFYACTALKSVELPDTVTTIGNYAFRKCAAIETLNFGEELVTIGECSFYGCTGLTELVIPDKVTTIKPYAFKTCTGLTGVTLGNAVATIGEGAFNTCTGLKTIVFPASLTTIGDYAFSGSYNLWQITFTGDAPTIGTGAFKGLAATAYYPAENTSWTNDVMQNYGGTITWKAN